MDLNYSKQGYILCNWISTLGLRVNSELFSAIFQYLKNLIIDLWRNDWSCSFQLPFKSISTLSIPYHFFSSEPYEVFETWVSRRSAMRCTKILGRENEEGRALYAVKYLGIDNVTWCGYLNTIIAYKESDWDIH